MEEWQPESLLSSWTRNGLCRSSGPSPSSITGAIPCSFTSEPE